MPYLNINGADLYYEAFGEGPPLVVAHGLMGSVAQMAQYGERLELFAERGLRVVAYDAHGHGRSRGSRGRDGYTWAAQAQNIRGVIDALDLGRANVYGGSMGAGAALMLALEHPEAVDRLVLRAPPPFDDSIRDVLRPFAQIAALYRVFGTKLTASIVLALPPGRAAQRRAPNVDLRRFIVEQQAVPIADAIEALRNGPRLPVECFGKIGRPALILAHPDDPLHPLASAELLHERMPHARLAIAPDATYWAQQPAYLAEIVAAFVKGELTAEAGQRTFIHEHAAR